MVSIKPILTEKWDSGKPAYEAPMKLPAEAKIKPELIEPRTKSFLGDMLNAD